MKNKPTFNQKSIDSTIEATETTPTGTRFVIGGENYEPIIGEKPKKVLFKQLPAARKHYFTAAQQEYKAQGVERATIFSIELDEGKITGFNQEVTYNIRPDDF